MESWRTVWRDGFAKVLSLRGLLALRDALVADDKRLIQGTTMTPPPMACVRDFQVEAACAIGLCGWQGEKLGTVGEVEEQFAKACFEADSQLGEEAACRWFLNWFDDTPRPEMIRELLPEVELAIKEQSHGHSDHDSDDNHSEDQAIDGDRVRLRNTGHPQRSQGRPVRRHRTAHNLGRPGFHAF
jgi:hypothetical protein